MSSSTRSRTADGRVCAGASSLSRLALPLGKLADGPDLPFPSLSRRIELSGRGGEWEPSQRRAVKVEAEKRKRLVYKSTDTRP